MCSSSSRSYSTLLALSAFPAPASWLFVLRYVAGLQSVEESTPTVLRVQHGVARTEFRVQEGNHLADVSFLRRLSRLFHETKMAVRADGHSGQYYMAQAGGNAQRAAEIPSLDEPVNVTIVRATQMRDLQKIALKLKYVVLPQEEEGQSRQLRDWDLWGPLLLCLLLSFTLSVSSAGSEISEESSSAAFGIVFTVVWVGATVVVLNAQLLGSAMYSSLSSFFQSVCVLGYCLFPVTLGAILGLVLGGSVILVRLLCVAVGCAWSVKSAFGFMQHLTPEKRWKLAAYPVLLLYVYLGWLVMIV